MPGIAIFWSITFWHNRLVILEAHSLCIAITYDEITSPVAPWGS